MSCEVAALSFQAYANYWNWSIDFDCSNSDFSKFFYLVFKKPEILKIASHDDLYILYIQ